MRKLLTIVFVLSFVPVIAAAQTFSTTMTGANEVPGPGDPDGSGIAIITISGTSLNYVIAVQNIAAPTAAHIHRGGPTVANPPLVNFNPTFTNGLATGTVAGVDAALISEIAGNPAGFYFNVHTGDFPNGAIRGQLGAPSGQGVVAFFPVVGKVAGGAGTNFITDLRIINQGSSTANVTLDFFQSALGGQTAPNATRTITVAAGEQKVLDDVTGATLNTSGLGALRISSDRPVSATARIINDLRASGQGTSGFATTAASLDDAQTAGTLEFLSQASGADFASGIGFRTNIGYFNPNSSAAAVTFTARRTSDGTVLGTATVSVPGFSQVQQAAFSLINSVAAGDQAQSNFYVTWTSNAPVFVYGSVVDNKTGDSVLVQ